MTEQAEPEDKHEKDVRRMVGMLYMSMQQNGCLPPIVAGMIAINIVIEDLWGAIVMQTLDVKLNDYLEHLQEIVEMGKLHSKLLQKRSRIMFWLNVFMTSVVTLWLSLALSAFL